MAQLAALGAVPSDGVAAMDEGVAGPAAAAELVPPQRIPLHVYAMLGLPAPAPPPAAAATHGPARLRLDAADALPSACAPGPEFGTRAAADPEVRASQNEEAAQSQRAVDEPAWLHSTSSADATPEEPDSFEQAELAALGTLAAVPSNAPVPHREPEAVRFHLQGQVIPLCLSALNSYQKLWRLEQARRGQLRRVCGRVLTRLDSCRTCAATCRMRGFSSTPRASSRYR